MLKRKPDDFSGGANDRQKQIEVLDPRKLEILENSWRVFDFLHLWDVNHRRNRNCIGPIARKN